MDVESGGDVDSTQGRAPAGEPGHGASGVPTGAGGTSAARAPTSDLTAGHRSYPWLDVLFLVIGVLTLGGAVAYGVDDRDWTRVVWYGLMGIWCLSQAAYRRRLRQKATRSGEGS